MKHWTIKKRIVCGFTSIFLLLAMSSIRLLRKVETNKVNNKVVALLDIDQVVAPIAISLPI